MYSNRESMLENTLFKYDAICVRGCNAFVLAQVMKLSGLMKYLRNYTLIITILFMWVTVTAYTF